ncbi:restriction endonuclease subunit S [Pseudarthrobacter sp. YS3]|uniref:restriction endonuclease subunit S n=1 Tax=Pseudarthrobacter sp. YS3 TaxID=3453718 RepID=UPI003EF078FF
MTLALEEFCSHVVDCKNRTAPEDPTGEYFAVGTPAMRGNVINYSEARRINEATFAEWTARLLPREGDILFAREAPVGPVVSIPAGGKVAAGQRTMLLRTDPEKADSDFLRLYLSAPITQARILALAHGSTTPHLRVADVRSFPVDLPSLNEQKAVAEVLGALDDKIAANTKLATTADDFLSSTFTSLLTNDLKEVPLSEIAYVNVDTVKPTMGGQLRYIDIASVGVGTYEFPTPIDWESAPSRARRRVRKGDTIWSTVRPNRRSHALNLSDDPLLVGSTGLAVLSPRTVGFAYLYEVTKRTEFTSYLETVAEGSAYPAVRADRFQAAPVPLLSENDRRSFEALAEPLRESLHSLSEENIALAATRDALLPQLMSGKLRVKDAEAVLETAGV